MTTSTVNIKQQTLRKEHFGKPATRGQDKAAGQNVRGEDDYINALVVNNVPGTLTYYDQSLSWGKFTSGPVGTIAGNSRAGAWYACGRQWSPSGTEGWVEYQAPDGTIFQMQWNVPYSGPNTAAIVAIGPNAARYDVSVDVNDISSGMVATYTITPK